jgi:hypothetical protein
MYWENLNIAQFPGTGPYDIPKMLPCSRVEVDKWVSFNEAAACPAAGRRSTGVHFWVDDEHFRRAWSHPRRTLALLEQFGAVCSPEFSVYDHFPAAVRIYNMYRNAWLARYWAEEGVNVVPSILWSYAGGGDFIWDCYPERSIVALSTVGCMSSPAAQEWLERGVAEMEKRLRPSMVILHGKKPDSLTVPFVPVPTFTSIMKKRIRTG